MENLISKRANEIRNFIQQSDQENAKTYARDLYIKSENNELEQL